LTGCQSVQNPIQGTHLTGAVFGGQQPVSGSAIQLYAVGSAGDGSAAASLIGTTLTTTDGTGQSNSNANAGNANNSHEFLFERGIQDALNQPAVLFWESDE
jgi:hypothetical protein